MSYLLPKFEKNILKEGKYERIVGIDEVGRGAWAGPVAVGAFIYDLSTNYFKGVNDSKQVSRENREVLYTKLSKHKFQVLFGDVEKINKYGIGRTITDLIYRHIDEIGTRKTLFIVDGQFRADFGRNIRKEIKADSTYYSVAAASILAKVERDSLMRQLHFDFPEYFFNRNVGYPTKAHRDVLNLIGPTILHRTSFTPIKLLVTNRESMSK